LDPENAVQTYIDANEARFRITNEMYRTIQNMRKSGLSDAEIRRALRKNKVANISELMRGKFVPFTPSSEIKKRVRSYGNRLPMAEINAARREFRQRKLGEPVPEAQVEEPAVIEVETPAQQPVQQAPVSSPSFTLTPATPPSNLGAPQQQPDTSLLGSNPIDILKNLQIFQRQQ
jgi:hypothetical protein